MFSKERGTGKDGNDIMAEYGVEIIPANKDRIRGWNLFRQYLKDRKLFFFTNCTHAIETIPALVHDKIKVEDIDTKSEDHAADAIRYGLMSLPPIPDRAELERVQNQIVNPYIGDQTSPWYNDNKSFNYNELYNYR
jgi:hypothetical protein